MVFPGARLFRAPIWRPSEVWRHARGREHCRGEPGSTLSGEYAPDSAKAEGSPIVDEPGEYWTPVRENQGANWEVSEEKRMSDHGLFSSYEGEQGAANGQHLWGVLRDAQGFGRLDAGSRAGFTSSRPPPPCVCVCVFFPFILDIKFVGRTSRGHTGGRSHRIFNPPSFCGACLDFCREKDSAIPFPRRP